MAVSQDYVNQLVREAAAQAGGALSYADVANAAANLGIPISQVNAAMSTGVVAAPAVADVVSQISPGQSANIGGVVYQPVYDSTGQGETFEQGPLKEVLVYKQNQQTGDAYKQYSPTGEYVRSGQFKDVGNFGDLLKDAYTALGPIPMMALTAGGAGALLGGSLGLTGTAANVAGGALLGGGNAALTGSDILKGAVLGGAGGYLQGSLNAPAEDSIYSLANGNQNLNYMGGGQGLTSTGAANLASMGGGQGLQILAGLPSTTLAEALSSFAGVNPSVLADMGLGSGITYVTPSGIVTENGTIIGGDVIGELGKNTGFDLTNWLNDNVGSGIGTELAKVDTGVSTGTGTGVGTGTGKVTGTGTGKVTTTGTGKGTGINIGDVLKTVVGTTILTDKPVQTGFNVVPVPTDWKTPTYGQTGSNPNLKPIDFGSRDLLRGTQWEKYLNPAPTLAAPMQPMGMGYDQLVGALQGGQGGNLTLNDIISGIQGQYGQTPSGTVG